MKAQLLKQKSMDENSPTKINKATFEAAGEGGSPVREMETKEAEPEPEDDFEIPVDKTIFYDFVPHNGSDPILLSLFFKRTDNK